MPLPTNMNPGSPAARIYNAHQRNWRIRDGIDGELRTVQRELEHARAFMARPPKNATPLDTVTEMTRIPRHEQAIAELEPRLDAAEAAFQRSSAALAALEADLRALEAYVQGRGPAPDDERGRPLTIETARASYLEQTGQTTDRIEEMAALEDVIERDKRKPWHPVLPRGMTAWDAQQRYYDMTNGHYYTPLARRGKTDLSLSEQLLSRYLDVHWGPAKIVGGNV